MLKKPFQLLLIILPFLVSFIFACLFKNIYTPDSHEYLIQAHNMDTYSFAYSGSDIQHPDPFFISLRPPGYSMFICVVKWFTEANIIIALFQALLYCLCICIIFKETNKLNYSTIIIPVAVLFFPLCYVIPFYLISDALFGTLIFFAFYFLLCFDKSRQVKYWMLFNAFLSIGVLTKPVTQFYLIFSLVIAFLYFFENRDFKILAIWVLLPLTVLAWSYRNYIHTGLFHFSSISMQILPWNYAQDLLAIKFGPDQAYLFIKNLQDQADKMPSFPEKFNFLTNSSKEIIINELPSFIFKQARGMLAFFLDPGRYFIYNFIGYVPEKEVSIIQEIDRQGTLAGIISYLSKVNLYQIFLFSVIVIWNFISFILILILPFTKTLNFKLKFALLSIVFYIAFFSTLNNYGRYKTEVYPLMIFSMAISFNFLKEKVMNGKAKNNI